MMMGAGMIGMVVFWVLVIWVGVHLASREGSQNAARPLTALELLEERYARGEIDEKELEARRRALRRT